jgi:hypothetical protein
VVADAGEEGHGGIQADAPPHEMIQRLNPASSVRRPLLVVFWRLRHALPFCQFCQLDAKLIRRAGRLQRVGVCARCAANAGSKHPGTIAIAIPHCMS